MSGLAVFFHTQQLADSLAVAGYAVGAYSLLSSLTAALRGHAIDRWGQTLPLLVLVPTFSLATIGLGALAQTGREAVLFAAIMGLTAPPINLSVRPLWKDLAGEERVRTAYALDTTILNSTGLIGPVIGTWIALNISGSIAMYTTAGFMLVGGSLLLSSQLSRNWKPEAKVAGEAGIFKSRAMRFMALEGALIGLGFGLFDVAIPSAATLADMPGWAAPSMAAIALGGIVGGFLAGSTFKHVEPGKGLAICQTLFAISALPLFLVSPGLPTVLLILIGGLPLGIAQVFYLEVVDIVRPRGTAVAALGTIWFIEGSAAALGNALAGVVSEAYGAAPALIAVSVLFVLSVFVLRYAIATALAPALSEAHAKRQSGN
jgi:MFS family permease